MTLPVAILSMITVAFVTIVVVTVLDALAARRAPMPARRDLINRFRALEDK
jgi:hypothetical protein